MTGNVGFMVDKPNCFNRPHYHQFVEVQRGWTEDGRRITAWIPDPMSKTCQQHGKLGEATLKHWDCAGCIHLHTAPKSA